MTLSVTFRGAGGRPYRKIALASSTFLALPAAEAGADQKGTILVRRTLFAIAAASALVALTAGSALAAPPQTSGAHFMSASGSVDSTGALVVSFDEAGVGTSSITYSLNADATATYACINGGGNHPKAANKETNAGDVSGGATFEPKHGRVTGSVSAGPISAGSFSCPSGQRLVLAAVSYTNIVLTDTQNNVSVSIADTSRIFFDV
jgi:hypothetical protein